jgi:hypothetical protein
MPDTGDFDREHEAPPGWRGAFAALPQDAPDAGAWQRVQARLPASTARARWPLWLASAAVLALVALIPLRMPPAADADPTASVSQATPAPTAARPAVPATQQVVASTTTPEVRQIPVPVASRAGSRRPARIPPSQRPIRTVATPADATHLAKASETPAATDLEPLYAQSAQLESLLAMARDERMASGTSAALADGLDELVANIDAALAKPGLDATRRAELWGQRVDALQQLVGIETTQRLYAARGQSYQAALVSID